jgi:hypothetical protein
MRRRFGDDLSNIARKVAVGRVDLTDGYFHLL